MQMFVFLQISNKRYEIHRKKPTVSVKENCRLFYMKNDNCIVESVFSVTVTVLRKRCSVTAFPMNS